MRHLDILSDQRGLAVQGYALALFTSAAAMLSFTTLGIELGDSIGARQNAEAQSLPETPSLTGQSSAAVGTWTRLTRSARHLFANKYTKASHYVEYAIEDLAIDRITTAAARRQIARAEALTPGHARNDTALKLVDSIWEFRRDPEAFNTGLEQSLMDDVTPVLNRLANEDLDRVGADKLHGELMAAFSGKREEGYQAQLLRRLIPEGANPELDRLHDALTNIRERRWRAWWVLESSVRGFGTQDIPVVNALPKTARVDEAPMATIARIIEEVSDPQRTTKLMPIAIETEYNFVVDPSYSRIQADLHKMASDAYLLAHPEHAPTLNGSYLDSSMLRTQRKTVEGVIAEHNATLRANAARFFEEIALGKDVDTSNWSWAMAYRHPAN